MRLIHIPKQNSLLIYQNDNTARNKLVKFVYLTTPKHNSPSLSFPRLVSQEFSDRKFSKINFNMCLNFKLIFSLDKHYIFMKTLYIMSDLCFVPVPWGEETKNIYNTKQTIVWLRQIHLFCFHNSFNSSLSLFVYATNKKASHDTGVREKAFRTLILQYLLLKMFFFGIYACAAVQCSTFSREILV